MSLQVLNILLADDDTDDCLFFKDALEGMPVSIKFTAVHDGEQLMQLLNQENNELPHILFLDLNMPRMNGFECLTEIKQNKNLDNLPVVIFSTSFEKEVVNLLYESGAQYFIRKPSEFAQFQKIIFHVLTLVTQYLLSGEATHLVQPERENFVLSVENILII
jgi:CheY-like chemotaxis protein